MNKQFLQLELHDSEQQPSCITMENWIDTLNNPDFRKSLNQCNDHNSMVDLFPIVGYGIQVRRSKYDSNSQIQQKIKVVAVAKVEKIIDLSGLGNKSRDKSNCILPLLKKSENNSKLLNCELFKKKISNLLTKNNLVYIENSYICLIQSTLKYMIKIFDNSEWQKEILNEIFEVCEQVFLETNLYIQDIGNEQFKASTYQLLNVFCHLQMNVNDHNLIYNNFILPLLQKKRFFQLNDVGQNGLGTFFDCLNVKDYVKGFDNINKTIEQYLDEHNYFYMKIFYGKFLSKFIELFIPKTIIKEKLMQERFFNLPDIELTGEILQNQDVQLFEAKIIIKNFTKATIHKYLLDQLLREKYNKENRTKLLESLKEAVYNENYYAFLQNHSKYDILVQFYNLNNLLSDQSTYSDGLYQFEQFMINQLMKKVQFSELMKKQYDSSQKLKESLEISKLRQLIQQYAINFGLEGENELQIEKQIIDIITEICWMNYLAVKTNIENDQDIFKFLNFIKNDNFLKSQGQLNFYQRHYNTLVQFCFIIYWKTSQFTKFDKFEQEELKNLIPKDPQKAKQYQKIFDISKSLKK